MSIREFLAGTVEVADETDGFRVRRVSPKSTSARYELFYKRKGPFFFYQSAKKVTKGRGDKSVVLFVKVSSLKKAKDLIKDYISKEVKPVKPKFTTKEALNILIKGLGASENKLGNLNFDQQDAYKILKTALKIK